jgi:hypothetical protein
MYYRIDEIKRDARVDDSRRSHARLLVYVSFLGDDDKLLWREGFAMDVPATITRIITKNGLWQRSDGVFVDPATLQRGAKVEWRRETVTADVPAIIQGNIERYMAQRASRGDKPKRGAHFDKSMLPVSSDAKGILERADVQQMKGASREAKEVRDARA